MKTVVLGFLGGALLAATLTSAQGQSRSVTIPAAIPMARQVGYFRKEISTGYAFADEEMKKQLRVLGDLGYGVTDFKIDLIFRNYAVTGSGGANPVYVVWIAYVRP